MPIAAAVEATWLLQAHLSGDIHSAGSIVFYVLTGGAHAFGKNSLQQQVGWRRRGCHCALF